VPSLTEVLARPAPYYSALGAAVANEVDRQQDRDDGMVLMGHSGAGALLPGIAAAANTKVAGMVFVDALLPHPGRSWLETVPAEMREQLIDLAEDGFLPRWNEWFPPGTIERLVPEAKLRASFCRDLPRLPLDYFTEPAPEFPSPDPASSAYLKLSDAYTAEANEAERRGWFVTSLVSHHLAIFTEPEEISEKLIEIADAITG
jgi:hypothetical protein